MFARPGLPGFDYIRAETADQVVSVLLKHGEAAKLLMGGTDLFPGLRDGGLHPQVVVDVKGLPGIRDVSYDSAQGLTVGAAVTMNELARHPEVQARYSLLAQSAEAVATYQIRNRATFGGNLCNASPCADTAPATLVLEAHFLLYGPDGGRSVPAGEFFLGPGRTALRPAEYLAAISFPPLAAGAAGRYLKLGRCKTGDLALVGVAVLGFRDGTPSSCCFRIGLGSVAPTPIRAPEAEKLLASRPPGEEVFALAADKVMQASSPITDVRGTAGYQKAMVRTLTLRGLREVWQRLAEA